MGLNNAVSYFPPQRDEKCRVCVQLDAEGDTVDIYEDHYHSVPAGCPRFAAMKMQEKIRIAKLVKLYLFCMDSEQVQKPHTPHQTCPVQKKKMFYTCVEKSCKMHFWLCEQHVKLNKSKFDNAKKYWSQKGKGFANFTNMYHCPKPKVESFDHETVAEVRNDGVTCCIKEATKQLKEAAKGSTVLDVPEGEPMFMFSCAVGKKNPVKIFYDKGCSHVVFCQGIPGT